MLLENTRLDVIATFRNTEQEFINLSVNEGILKDEDTLLDYIEFNLGEQGADLRDDNLIKLSLCWECSDETVEKYKTIKDSIEKKGGKYYFGEYDI
jgi:hypothetical protein